MMGNQLFQSTIISLLLASSLTLLADDNKSRNKKPEIVITEAYIQHQDIDANGIPDGDPLLIVRGHQLCRLKPHSSQQLTLGTTSVNDSLFITDCIVGTDLDEIHAYLPVNLVPGTYSLTLNNDQNRKKPKQRFVDTFDLTIGAVGPQGEPGLDGESGVKGDTGDQGIQGLTGAIGDAGDQGAQGLTGAKGDAGDQGPQGLTGAKGDAGDQGAQGLAGAKGDAGDQGEQGLTGAKGDAGDQGEQGLTGAKGDSGDQGVSGKNAQNLKRIALGRWYDYGVNADVTLANAGPAAMIYDGNHIWVADVFQGQILRINEGTMETIAIGVGPKPIALALVGWNLWVANSGNSTVSIVRMQDRRSVTTISGIAQAQALAFDGESVWVGANDGVIRRYSTSGALELTVNHSVPAVQELFFDGSHIWASAYSSDELVKINLDGSIAAVIPVGDGPNGITFDGEHIWLAHNIDATVRKISRTTNSVVEVFQVGAGPQDIIYDGTDIWTANFDANTVSRISVADNINLGEFPTRPQPRSLAFDGANVWVGQLNGASAVITKR